MKEHIINRSMEDVAIAYISTAVPDIPRFHTRATHHGGLTFTLQILYGLAKRFPNVTAFSAIPIESYPRGNQVWVGPEKLILEDGTISYNVPFLNITPLKQILIGLFMFLFILKWSWNNRKIKNRLLYSFNTTVPPIIFTALAARLVKAKVVAYICDVVIPGHTQPDTLWNRIDYYLQLKTIKYLDGLIVITDAIAQDFGSDKPYCRMEGGISDEIIEKTGQYLTQAKRDNRLFTLIATGTLLEHNGIKLILQAFQLLAGDHYRLKIAGRGPLEKIVQKAAANDSRINFVGFVSYDDSLRLHASGDILLNMRITEALVTNYAFPSKTFDYLLSGVPVINTPTGHMQEEFANYCFMLKEENPLALVKMIRHVEQLNPEKRWALGSNAREYIIQNYSWHRQNEKICDYISQQLFKL